MLLSKKHRRLLRRADEDTTCERKRTASEPKHYRLIKRSACKFARKYQATLSYSDLDEIASRATVYFIEAWNSSNLADIDHRLNVCAARSARRAVCEYWSESRIGTKTDNTRIKTVDNDALAELFGQSVECKPDNTEAMLARLNRRQRIVALGLIAGDSWDDIASEALYKNQCQIADAKRAIRKRLTDYQPECHLMRAVREACELFIQSEFPKVEQQPIESDNDNRDDIPRPRRAKSTRPVDTAIPAQPGEFRPMPELWARHIGLGQGRGNVIAQLENARYQQWLTIFAR